jgi:hypothetical protein
MPGHDLAVAFKRSKVNDICSFEGIEGDSNDIKSIDAMIPPQHDDFIRKLGTLVSLCRNCAIALTLPLRLNSHSNENLVSVAIPISLLHPSYRCSRRFVLLSFQNGDYSSSSSPHSPLPSWP